MDSNPIIETILDDVWAGDRRVSLTIGDRLISGRIIAIRSRHEIVESYTMDVAKDDSDHIITIGIGPLA